ncbi:hypothetical protein NDU88_006052 [Pleurodeles waltl]|uniref:Uncharacterized protein n=1 Tax=Pleurodeles waltl TaxID=8319 RepID=A0AAV7N7K3_PLEWA|nr:hypothetical protein NDU88_006052 [Pleurodeles waltl]
MRERQGNRNGEQTVLRCCTRSVSFGDRVNSNSSARRAQQHFSAVPRAENQFPDSAIGSERGTLPTRRSRNKNKREDRTESPVYRVPLALLPLHGPEFINTIITVLISQNKDEQI